MMDVGDRSAPSNLADCNKSQNRDFDGKVLHSTPEDASTKSENEKFVCYDNFCKTLFSEVGCSTGIQAKTNSVRLLKGRENHDEIKFGMEDRKHDSVVSCKTKPASNNLLDAVNDFLKKEVTSSDKFDDSACVENEKQRSLVDKEMNEYVETVSKEVISSIVAVDDPFKRPEKLETSNFKDCGERKPDDCDEKLSSDAPVSEQTHTSNCKTVRSENEGLVSRKDSDVHASCDMNFPVDNRISANEQKVQNLGEQKHRKADVKQKCDSLRPVGRLLHDLGVDLVREQVYIDLIGIQMAKDVKNMLDEKEREQLKRLTDAHSKLVVKNAMYQLPVMTCRCNFSSSSVNVMALHHEFGSMYEASYYKCCLCEGYKTHWLSQFLAHLECSHQKKGRVQTKLAPNVCRYCPYEHKNQARMEAHASKCVNKFNLNTNLQPLPADCDIPIMGKTSQPMSSSSLRPGVMAGPSGLSGFPAGHGVHQVQRHTVSSATAANVGPSVMEIGGQLYSLVHHNGKALFTSLRSQIAGTHAGNHSSDASSSAVIPGNFPRFAKPSVKPVADARTSNAPVRVPFAEKCEMCDAVVKDRDALWNHFRLQHKVELSRVSMIEKEPWMTCDVCLAKFWTYQGLTRHSVRLHKRELSSQSLPMKSFKCFLCLQTQTNPLNHLSTFHNITLLDMYHSRRCCMCNKRFRSAPAFEEHMVLQHHDIFANKDVLCTVLQALSTALNLKRQETLQHRLATQASFSKTSPQSSTAFGPGSSCNARGTASSAAVAFPKNSPEAHLPNKMPTINKVSSANKAPTAAAGQPEAKKRHRQSSEQSKESDSSDAIKTPKKSSEEDVKELNKLYAEYADIGRPILRSMRHRLSQNSLEKNDDCPKESSASPQDEADTKLSETRDDALTEDTHKSAAESNLSGESTPKRVCLESRELNDSTHINQLNQMHAVNNGDVTDITERQKTSHC